MIAFDTDVLSELLSGRSDYVARAATLPADQLAVPIVAAEEMLRGRLDAIRRAEAGQGRASLVEAYGWFERNLSALRASRLLPYTDAADSLFRQWRQQKLRFGAHDLRIAAIAVSHAATLVTRNRRDYALIPGLQLEVW